MYSQDGLALRHYGCTYLGVDYDPRTHQGSTPYCGSKDLVNGTLYCEQHYALMYQKGSALRKRHKDQRRANSIRELVSDFNAVVEELELEGFDLYGDASIEKPLA